MASIPGKPVLTGYSRLRGLHVRVASYASAGTPSHFSESAEDVFDYLTETWCSRYRQYCTECDIVEVALAHTGLPKEKGRQRSYIFDVMRSRLIAAWGVSYGYDKTQTSDKRLKGHPSAGEGRDKGHAIKRLVGAGEDINLVRQLRLVNNSAFKALENRAMQNPGALYFTYWFYDPADAAREEIPTGVEQGLLRPGFDPALLEFPN